MAVSDKPVEGNLPSYTDENGKAIPDEKIGDAIEKADKEPVDYGKDVGSNFFVQVGSLVGGCVLGGWVGDKISNGNKITTALGTVIGGLFMRRIGAEVATDIQRGNQYVDQQKERGLSEGKLSDRFKAVLGNISDIKGQKYEPDPDLDV